MIWFSPMNLVDQIYPVPCLYSTSLPKKCMYQRVLAVLWILSNLLLVLLLAFGNILVISINPHSQVVLPPLRSSSLYLSALAGPLPSLLHSAGLPLPAVSGPALAQFHAVSVVFLVVTGHILSLSNCLQPHKMHSLFSLLHSFFPLFIHLTDDCGPALCWAGKHKLWADCQLNPILVEPRV